MPFRLLQPASHGLGFSSSDIGTSLASLSLATIGLSMFLFPVLERRFGGQLTLYGGAAVTVACSVLYPDVSYAQDNPRCAAVRCLHCCAVARRRCVRVLDNLHCQRCTQGPVGAAVGGRLAAPPGCLRLLQFHRFVHQQFCSCVRAAAPASALLRARLCGLALTWRSAAAAT